MKRLESRPCIFVSVAHPISMETYLPSVCVSDKVQKIEAVTQRRE